MSRLVKNVRRSSSFVDIISSISPNKSLQKRASQINTEIVMKGFLTKLGGVVRYLCYSSTLK